MDDQQREGINRAARHLVTLAIAALGFVITMMFATSDREPLVQVTRYRMSLQASLLLYLCAVVFGFLSVVFGSTALVVFALANAFGLPALGGTG